MSDNEAGIFVVSQYGMGGIAQTQSDQCTILYANNRQAAIDAANFAHAHIVRGFPYIDAVRLTSSIGEYVRRSSATFHQAEKALQDILLDRSADTTDVGLALENAQNALNALKLSVKVITASSHLV